ncbi:hypothetical protein BDB01DRAFT_851229 [Pilobolus umbonatus]|nr:hypothetical protein BDB01DRAFT_851229 [Pilobolus umbonatus]
MNQAQPISPEKINEGDKYSECPVIATVTNDTLLSTMCTNCDQNNKDKHEICACQSNHYPPCIPSIADIEKMSPQEIRSLMMDNYTLHQDMDTMRAEFQSEKLDLQRKLRHINARVQYLEEMKAKFQRKVTANHNKPYHSRKGSLFDNNPVTERIPKTGVNDMCCDELTSSNKTNTMDIDQTLVDPFNTQIVLLPESDPEKEHSHFPTIFGRTFMKYPLHLNRTAIKPLKYSPIPTPGGHGKHEISHSSSDEDEEEERDLNDSYMSSNSDPKHSLKDSHNVLHVKTNVFSAQRHTHLPHYDSVCPFISCSTRHHHHQLTSNNKSHTSPLPTPNDKQTDDK